MAEKKTIKIPKVKVLYDKIITSFKNENTTKNGIVLLKPESRQTVVACGPNSNVSVGDDIEINYNLFPTRKEYPKNGIGADKESIILPTELIDGEEYLFISSREVKWIYLKD